MFTKLKLKPKLISIFLLIGLFPMLVMSVITYTIATNVISTQATEKFALFASQKERLLSDWLNSQKELAGLLSKTKEIVENASRYSFYSSSSILDSWRSLDEVVLRPFLQKLKKEHGFSEIFFVNNQGIVISSSNKEMLDFDYSNHEFIKNMSKEGSMFSNLFYSKFTKSTTLAITVPLYEQINSEYVGACVYLLDSKNIDKILQTELESIGDSADSYLINSDGLLLTLPKYNPELTVLKSKVNTEDAAELTSALKSSNLKFNKELTSIDFHGKKVLSHISYFLLGKQPVGLTIKVDYDEVFSIVNQLQTLIFILVSAIAIIVTVIGAYFANSLVKPIKEINNKVEEFSQGNLMVEFDIVRNDEIGDLAKEENAMVRHISTLVQHIITIAGRVQSISQDIYSGNEDLSQRTQEQASTLEEVAATIKEIAQSIQQVAASSDQAGTLSKTTLEAVKEGEKSVEETKEAMNQISASSTQIGEIIKVVNDIAFQTNLLALNAAVEAARAGEQGRGFAVVAAEVRNLASRSSASAKEVEVLINESAKRVDRGNALVQKSSEILELIIDNTKQTSDVIMNVAAAMRDQSTASQQIQTSIEQLNKVTQQNASMVQEINSSSQSLNSESELLRDAVNEFKLENDNDE